MSSKAQAQNVPSGPGNGAALTSLQNELAAQIHSGVLDGAPAPFLNDPTDATGQDMGATATGPVTEAGQIGEESGLTGSLFAPTDEEAGQDAAAPNSTAGASSEQGSEVSDTTATHETQDLSPAANSAGSTGSSDGQSGPDMRGTTFASAAAAPSGQPPQAATPDAAQPADHPTAAHAPTVAPGSTADSSTAPLQGPAAGLIAQSSIERAGGGHRIGADGASGRHGRTSLCRGIAAGGG